MAINKRLHRHALLLAVIMVVGLTGFIWALRQPGGISSARQHLFTSISSQKSQTSLTPGQIVHQATQDYNSK
jgi:hypothetical protein